MSVYLRALRERKLAHKAAVERQEKQLAELSKAAENIVAEAREQAQAERQQILAAARGDDGEMGPMPRHQWRGTKLRFEDGERNKWGKFVDLQGKQGSPGAPGRGGGGSNLAALSLLQGQVADTDTMVIERAGSLFRVTIANLKDALGTALPADTVFAGSEPIQAGSDFVTASD